VVNASALLLDELVASFAMGNWQILFQPYASNVVSVSPHIVLVSGRVHFFLGQLEMDSSVVGPLGRSFLLQNYGGSLGWRFLTIDQVPLQAVK
jgi:hypothetical protein